MILHAKMSSERGKTVTKSGNEHLIMDISRRITAKGSTFDTVIARLIVYPDGKIYLPYNGNTSEVNAFTQDYPENFGLEPKNIEKDEYCKECVSTPCQNWN